MARLASWALAVALSAALIAAQATSPGARWGQSSALVSSHFLVYGGKTGSGFTYTSGPNDASLFSLDLSQPFTTSSAPWQLVQPIADNNSNGTTTTPPAVAFASLAPLTHRQVLLFGGDSTADAVQTSNDSVYTFQLVDVSSATWSQPQLSSQPMRRIGQSVESDGRGGVWVVGGQKDDGSGLDLNEAWSYNASSDGAQAFQSLPAPPASLVGATSTLLSDDSLLLLGGQDATGSLQSFSSVAAFDTTTKTWMMQNTTGSAMPAPRRNHIAVSLPSQRVFIHGGASDSALTTALSDAWILDWSVDPPVWSRVDDGTASGGPGARFGHSAVAVGRNIAMTCGWSGGNAAQEGVWVFDGTSLQSSGRGVWTGGAWTASYTPDGASSSSSSAQSGTNNAGGNGASTSSGASSSSSGSKGGSGSKSGASPSSTSEPSPFQPTSSNSSSPISNDDSTSPATKAGAAIGALVGCGLVVAGAYFLYQRHQDTKYRSVYAREAGFGGAGGAAGLLAGGAAMGGRDEEEAWAEKEMGAGGWYAASPAGPARRPAGPRAMHGGHEDGAWTAGNVPSSASHAREGSGPRMRQRLALLTGLASWGHATNGQTRFDMLADEEERDPYSMREQAGDDPFYEHDRGSYDADEDRDGFVSSPFEDREPPAVASSEQSHNTTTTGGTPNYTNSSHSSRSTGGPHTLTSFSDAAHARPLSRGSSMLGNSSWLSPAPWGPGVSDASGSMMRRSPTWWSRFMGNLERSASGRTVVLPGAGEPIRDPAQPSMVAPDIGLSVIREVPRSADPSEDFGADPFADGAAAATAGAGAVDATALANANAGSQTSLGSSHLEAQLQGMDVIQRTRTGSSRRTQSTRSSVWTSGGSRKRGRGRPSEQGSLGAESSRMGSVSEEAVVRGGEEGEETIDAEETPGEVVWGGPADWQGEPIPHLPHLTTSTAWLLSPHDEDPADGSMDIVSQLHDEPDTTATPYTYDHAARRAANASDTPSLTPATTKRARANTELTSPVRKAAKRSPTNVYLSEFGAPGNRTVRDRVKLIEGAVGGGGVAEKGAASPARKKSHGLAPRGQLFVANPDDE